MSKKPKNTEKSLDDIYSKLQIIQTKLNDMDSNIAKEITWQSQRITMLNETVYEDRFILAEFVRRFMRTPDDLAERRGELYPGIGAEGERKAKSETRNEKTRKTD